MTEKREEIKSNEYCNGKGNTLGKNGTRKRNIIKIATWNVRTMMIAGKMEEIALELEKYKIDIAAIQEIRWKGNGAVRKDKYEMRYSGGEKQGRNGVGFIIRGKVKQKVLEFNPISDRMAYIRIAATPSKISILNVYAPTEMAEEASKDQFYEDLDEELSRIPKEDTIIVLGDLNAQIGKEEYIKQVAGKHTVHDKSNDNGQRLCNLAAENNLVISSTKYKHPKIHNITWLSPDNKTHNQIDHVLVTRRKQSSIRDVRTYRGACADSDHYMVVATIKQKIKNTKTNKMKQHKWNVDSLNNPKLKEEYQNRIIKELTDTTLPANSIQGEWESLKQVINTSENQKINN